MKGAEKKEGFLGKPTYFSKAVEKLWGKWALSNLERAQKDLDEICTKRKRR